MVESTSKAHRHVKSQMRARMFVKRKQHFKMKSNVRAAISPKGAEVLHRSVQKADEKRGELVGNPRRKKV